MGFALDYGATTVDSRIHAEQRLPDVVGRARGRRIRRTCRAIHRSEFAKNDRVGRELFLSTTNTLKGAKPAGLKIATKVVPLAPVEDVWPKAEGKPRLDFTIS
jgi:hypothetical protein